MKRMRAGRLSRAVLQGQGDALAGEASTNSADGSLLSHQPFR